MILLVSWSLLIFFVGRSSVSGIPYDDIYNRGYYEGERDVLEKWKNSLLEEKEDGK